jgi:integrase
LWCFQHGHDPHTADPTAYLAEHRAAVSARAVYNDATCFKAFLRWRGEPDRAAAIRVRFPPLDEQPPYTDEDLGRLFSIASPRERDLCLLLLLTGLRANELIGAEPVQDGALARVVGKGGRVGYVALPFPLTGIVPRSYGILYRTIRELGLRAGVAATPRRFRTTHAHMMLAGHDLQTVQHSMRHERIATTAMYTKWGAKDRAFAAQRELARSVLARVGRGAG